MTLVRLLTAWLLVIKFHSSCYCSFEWKIEKKLVVCWFSWWLKYPRYKVAIVCQMNWAHYLPAKQTKRGWVSHSSSYRAVSWLSIYWFQYKQGSYLILFFAINYWFCILSSLFKCWMHFSWLELPNGFFSLFMATWRRLVLAYIHGKAAKCRNNLGS